MSDTHTSNTAHKVKRIPAGRAEFLQVWPLLVIASILVLGIYGIIIYESLFRLPLLGPVK